MEVDPEYFDELADMHEGIATELRNMAYIARQQSGQIVDYIPNTSPTPSVITMDTGYTEYGPIPKAEHVGSTGSMFVLSQGRDINALKRMMRECLIREGVVSYYWDNEGPESAKTLTRTEQLDKIQ